MVVRRRSELVRLTGLIVSLAAIASACNGDDDATTSSVVATVTAPPSVPVDTSAPQPTTLPTPPSTAAPSTAPQTTQPVVTVPPAEPGFDVTAIVGTLASDELTGRDDGTEGWLLAQTYLAEQLSAFADPVFPEQDGPAGYLQMGPSVNVLGIIPGSDMPDEYIVIGAHYDHLGDSDDGSDGCRVLDPADTICNGATDNATGVATVLAVAHAIAESGPPRRSVLVAFWDREEDGLLGSSEFVADPIVPLGQMVAYLNFDIQGSNLLPSLRETTVMVGAETGGQVLVDAAERATQASSLTTVALSLVFGQGRSDHASFVSAGIPSVFFTDANNGCYHTTRDDIAVVDFTKLDQQIATAVTLTEELAYTDLQPEIAPDSPVATYQDAVSMLAVTQVGQVDFTLVPELDRATLDQYVADLQRIVDEGEAAFDEDDIGPLLSGAATLVSALAGAECDGYLADG